MSEHDRKQIPALAALDADNIERGNDFLVMRDGSTGADVRVAPGTAAGRDLGVSSDQVPTNADADSRGFPQAVDSVADLQAGSFPASLKRIWLSGYYGVGTPGGGALYRDSDDTTTADNGGTVFVDADVVRWKRPESKEYSADQFGARLDGSADASSILTNAFPHIPTGGVFHWPGGMRISGQVLCERGDITVEGDLGAITVTQSVTEQNPFFRVQGESVARNKNFTLRNLRFVGDFASTLADFYSGGPDQRAGRVQIQYVDNVHVENIWGHRIDIAADVRDCDNATFNNIHVTESGMAVAIINVSTLNIDNCTGWEVTDSVVDYALCDKATLSNIVGVVSEEGEGFASEVIDAGQVRDLTVSNVIGVGPFDNGIRLKFDVVEDPSWHRVLMDNVSIYDHTLQAIFLASAAEGPKDVMINGLRVESSRAAASGVRRSGAQSITRVHLSDFYIETSIRCIDLSGCDDVVIADGAAHATDADALSAINLGFIDAARPGGKVSLDNVEVSYTSTADNGKAIRIDRGDRPTLNNVRVVGSSRREGIEIANCVSPRMKDCSVRNIGGGGILVQYTDAAVSLLAGRIMGVKIENCTVESWGQLLTNSRGISLVNTITGDNIHVFSISNNQVFIDNDVTPDGQLGIRVDGGDAVFDHGKIDNNIVYGTPGPFISTAGLGVNVTEAGNITG